MISDSNSILSTGTAIVPFDPTSWDISVSAYLESIADRVRSIETAFLYL